MTGQATSDPYPTPVTDAREMAGWMRREQEAYDRGVADAKHNGIPDARVLAAIIEDIRPEIIRSALLDSGEGLALAIVHKWREYVEIQADWDSGGAR